MPSTLPIGILHMLQINEDGQHNVFHWLERDVEDFCPVANMLATMGVGAFESGQCPPPGDYKTQAYRYERTLGMTTEYNEYLTVEPLMSDVSASD
jgi:hypothetical protein